MHDLTIPPRQCHTAEPSRSRALTLGAVLDAAALVLTTIRGVHRGQAETTKRVGAHLVADIVNIFHLSGDGSAVDREQFRQVFGRLARAGYELEPEEEAWRRFERAWQLCRASGSARCVLGDAGNAVGRTEEGRVSPVHEQQAAAPAQPSRGRGRQSPPADDALGQAASARVPD